MDAVHKEGVADKAYEKESKKRVERRQSIRFFRPSIEALNKEKIETIAISSVSKNDYLEKVIKIRKSKFKQQKIFGQS